MSLLSIIVPCLNESASIRPLIAAVDGAIPGVDAEFIFVDDGSTDETVTVLNELAAADARIHFISFSRHFGKEAALLAGLREASGELTVTMDADLQDPPELLPEMLRAITEEGFDSAATRRVSRKGEPIIRSFFAGWFYRVMNLFSDIRLVDGARDYRMMTRQMVEAVLAVHEVNRFTKGIYQWIGFRTKWFEFENQTRRRGETKWSFWQLFKYSLDGITAFSTAPLQLASLLGLLCCFGAVLAFLFVFVRALICGDPVSGWPSLACLIVFFSGTQLFVIGILGTYLAKTYLETKHRPVYLIREKR